VTLGSSVWKQPAATAGEVVPGWTLVNAKPVAPPNGPPPPTRKPALSVVAIPSNLKPDDRVIVEGVQRARPGSPVAPEEWELQPPSVPPAAKP
jgi:multidrug efflux system membrane fusion protein